MLYKALVDAAVVIRKKVKGKRKNIKNNEKQRKSKNITIYLLVIT